MEQDKQILLNKTGAKKSDTSKKTEASENKYIVKLSKSYQFEDEGEVSEIDLSGLKDATAEVLIKATRVLTMQDEFMVLSENDIRYAFFVAAECTEFTYEFYSKLNLCDATAVKRRVMSFFNVAE